MKRVLLAGLAMALAVSAGLAEEPQGMDLTKSLPIGDSLLVMVTGMAIVFLGLTVLIFLIKALVKATDGMGRKKKAAAPQVVIPPMKAFDIKTDDEPAAEDDALVAAITAALVCAMGGDGSGFVVRRIRRV